MKCDYNKEIKKFNGVYRVQYKMLVKDPYIQTVNDYNHAIYDLRHYIVFQSYSKNEDWYKDRGINQKLILLPKDVHILLHTCTDKFEYKGFKWNELLFCKKITLY